MARSVRVPSRGLFVATERCARCGAQACVETRTHSQSIDQTGVLWCTQHFTEQRMGILAAGARVARDSRKCW